MSMLLVTKQLLELELKSGDEFYRSHIQKELELLDRLDISFCNMTGTPEEFKKRLDGCEFIIAPKGAYHEMVNALHFKDSVRKHLEDIT